MQAETLAANDSSGKMLLTLAERLLEKAATDKKLTSVNALHLYFMVLEKQEKYPECLKLLAEDMGE